MRGIPDKGEAAAEYRAVVSNYEKAVQDSLNREEIPQGYKDTVRRYFESVRSKENE